MANNRWRFTPKVRAAGARAVRTAAQTVVASIGTTAAIEAVNWKVVLSTTALATLLSLLTSVITSLPEVPTEPTEGV